MSVGYGFHVSTLGSTTRTLRSGLLAIPTSRLGPSHSIRVNQVRSLAAIIIVGVLSAPALAGCPTLRNAVVGPGDMLSTHLVSAKIGLVWIASAFLGGLFLNLMPCVLPILIVRSLMAIQLALSQPGAARAQAAAFTTGAVLAMLSIGVALLVIRAGGSYVGWSPRSPIFVTVMAWFTFAIGLNLAGVFEIPPHYGRLGEWMARPGGARGSFIDGLLSATVSISCSAPFIGSAVAAALMAPPLEALGVFLALGLGLALPFAAICLMPGLHAFLPRPGDWMITLRQALSFPLFATAVWLLWILVSDIGADGAVIIAGGALLTAFLAWALRFRTTLSKMAVAAAILALCGLLAAIDPPNSHRTPLGERCWPNDKTTCTDRRLLPTSIARTGW